MTPRVPTKQLARARRMRREQTIAEEVMWRSLRNRGLGVKFRRQVPIGPFVVDFACVEAKVIVEVDGPPHETDEGAAQDTRRDAWLRAEGWRVVRVSNALVTGGGDLALKPIQAALTERGPFSRLGHRACPMSANWSAQIGQARLVFGRRTLRPC